MENRVSAERLLKHQSDLTRRPWFQTDFNDTYDLIFDLKDARAEIGRLNHKIELLQGPGEA